jgi:ubiquinone/menaquinone biosynthesis C-methylase UbiE
MAQALPYPANCFRNVVATFPTDYMLEPATLAEVYRVLQPGGCLVVVFEGYLAGPRPVKAVVDWLYQITGQRSLPPAKPLTLLLRSGFTARWETSIHNGASARLLIAQKQA